MGSCGVAERVSVEQVINEVTTIRNGQIRYREKFNRYATLQELAREGLASKDVEDGKAWGFSFTLTANQANYQLRVRKTILESEELKAEVLSLFVDESGVIRGSVNPQQDADARSIPA